jgi:hypothetical protein
LAVEARDLRRSVLGTQPSRLDRVSELVDQCVVPPAGARPNGHGGNVMSHTRIVRSSPADATYRPSGL